MHTLQPACQVRPLVAADAMAVACLLPATMGGEWSAAKVLALLDTRHSLRVLTRDGQVQGYAEYQRVLDQAELLALAIAPQYQGRGLGAALLQHIKSELMTAGCRRFLLEVRRSNTQAQRLYTSLGFVSEGVRKDYYPASRPGGQAEDALLYSCLLESS